MSEESRTAAQNRKMWAGLHDIARQVSWPQMNAGGQIQVGKMDAESWKCVLTAGLKQQQKLAQGIEGGWVMLGESSSRMKKRRFAELVTLILHFGDSKGVQWKDPDFLAMAKENEEWLEREAAKHNRREVA